MRIVFFGSSHGVPEPNRRCSCTLLEVGDNRYFIDMGTEPIPQLVTRRIPVDSVKGVFITHMHGDHTNGLISFLDLCTWYYKTPDPTIFLPEPVEDAVNAITAWIKCNEVGIAPYRFLPVNEGVIYEDEAIRVTAYQTQHTKHSYAYLVEAEGKRVLFTGDLRRPKVDFPAAVLDSPLDLAICEGAHFTVTEYLPFFEGCSNLKRLCFTHYTDVRMGSILEVAKALDPIPVSYATDGMEIVL